MEKGMNMTCLSKFLPWFCILVSFCYVPPPTSLRNLQKQVFVFMFQEQWFDSSLIHQGWAQLPMYDTTSGFQMGVGLVHETPF